MSPSAFSRIDCASLVFPLAPPRAPSKLLMQKRCAYQRTYLFVCEAIYVHKCPHSHTNKKTTSIGYRLFCIVCFELFPRIELGTSSLPRKCSTTELKQHLLPKSEAKVQRVFLLCNFLVLFFQKYIPLKTHALHY